MPKQDVAFDVTVIKAGDAIDYLNIDNGKAIVDHGVAKEDNMYTDGVEVYGDGWRQYVSKWYIVKVMRGEECLFEMDVEE